MVKASHLHIMGKEMQFPRSLVSRCEIPAHTQPVTR